MTQYRGSVKEKLPKILDWYDTMLCGRNGIYLTPLFCITELKDKFNIATMTARRILINERNIKFPIYRRGKNNEKV